MFDDLGTLCLVAIFVVVGLMLLPRLFGGMGNPDYSRRGDESPRYDDRDIESSGGFGGPGQRPRYDDPDIDSRGNFGSGSSGRQRRFSLPSWGNRRSGSSSGRADSPNIKSRGGFGRSKS